VESGQVGVKPSAHGFIPAGTASPHSGHTFGHHEHRQQWGAGGQQ
jgi:hypothetical protein